MLHILLLKNYLNSCIKTKICARIKYVSHIFYIRMCWFYYISSNIRLRYESKEPHSIGNVNLYSDRFSYICHFETLQALFQCEMFSVASGLTLSQQELVKLKINRTQ